MRHEQRLRELAAAICPEVSLYLFTARELEANGFARFGAWAWECPFNWRVLALLRAAGRWRGVRPIVVFDEELIDRHAHQHGWSPEKLTTTVFVHELGHCLPFESLPDPVAQDIEPDQTTLDRSAARYRRFVDAPPRPEPWAGHGHEFIRRALHLWWRADQAGCKIPLSILGCGRAYGLSHAREYLRALGNEPARMHDATFAEIEATPPPAEFVELFESDTTAWLDRHGPDRTPEPEASPHG